MRHVHHPHQAEDEREAGRDDEVEAGKREPVQEHDQEGPRLLGQGVLGEEEHPEQDEHAETDDDDAHGESERLGLEDAKPLPEREGFRSLTHPGSLSGMKENEVL